MQTNRSSEQIEMLIDEKCRILNKTGTPKSSALHLANWMKGQLDKQQEQARLAAALSRENINNEDEHLLYAENDQDERITYWTRQQLEKRTKELNLAKEPGHLSAKPNFGGKRLSGVEELSMSDVYSENVSQLSQSHSTTSDSQITVRSSPNVLDKLAVCRHCHKNCQQSVANVSPSANQQEHPLHANAHSASAKMSADATGGALVCTSLKVQHSQSSPNRCCKMNGIGSARGDGGDGGDGSNSHAGSSTSISSSTITGEQPSEHSSKVVASSSRRETGDTESDVAQLITDDVSQQSEATDESVNAIPSSSSGIGFGNGYDGTERQRITDTIGKLRILDDYNEARLLDGGTALMNGHCSAGSSGGDSDGQSKKSTPSYSRKAKPPQPPPRKIGTVVAPTASDLRQAAAADQRAKATVTIVETPTVVRNETTVKPTTITSTATPTTIAAAPPMKSPKSPRKPHNTGLKSPIKATQFMPCNCKCTPADFENTTLSPDEVQQETCKLIESPKQSPKMPREFNGLSDAKDNDASTQQHHQYRKCVCGGMRKDGSGAANDSDIPLTLIGLAPLTPTARHVAMKSPTLTPAFTQTFTTTTMEQSSVPTISVVPPTPEAILTKTTTNVWDNSASSATMNIATTSITNSAGNLQINSVPREPVIENMPEDSCDESPLDEEPPYRPMTNALRRYGTMSSLEKLPSDDRIDGDLDDLDDDDDDADVDEVEYDDNARADRVDSSRNRDRKSNEDLDAMTNATYTNELNETNGDENNDGSGGSAWTSRAGSFVGKMSFFEESRAFIDKYLGRWNQDTTAQPTSEPEEQMDECTSGATSGEEAWGTPTSGGENDEMHLNSENTHSSPTKSSTSLNDDDDTELMMDELLMAPPMTASTIRGLLPRRRLEPLFEEETESDEEKTQQESEDLKKGETTTNGRYLEDSPGSSSEEQENEDEEYDEEEEEEEPTSTEDRLQANLQTTTLGPRPLRDPGCKAAINSSSSSSIQLPAAVLKASSCEYLLEQRQSTSVIMPPAASSSNATTATSTATTTAAASTALTTTTTLTMAMAMAMETTDTMTTTMTTMMTTTTLTMTKLPMAKKSPVPSSTTTTISSASVTTSSANSNAYSTYNTSSSTSNSSNAAKSQARPAKFIPPPPPPRRLLLTQTNLKTNAGQPTPQHTQTSFGASADVGSSEDVAIRAATTSAVDSGSSSSCRPTTMTKSPPSNTRSTKPQQAAVAPTAACNTKSSVASIAATVKRPSSTIIETSLLGSEVPPRKSHTSISSTTVSMTTTTTTTTMMTTTTMTATTATASPSKEADSKSAAVQVPPGCGLSPRLEMRLALNHDILGDEDLICYDPGPDLTTILGHDLSKFHRLTGRDLLNRSAMSRVQPREAVISFSQQRNSKMDTPTVNRRPRPNVAAVQPLQQQQQRQQHVITAAPVVGLTTQPPAAQSGLGLVGSARVAGVPQHLRPNRNTWSNSVSAAPINGEPDESDASSRSCNYSSDATKLGDLEILARREKIYSMSQSRNGLQARMTTTTATAMMPTITTTMTNSKDSLPNNPQATRTTSITSMGEEIEAHHTGSMGYAQAAQRIRKIGRDESALIEAGKGSRLINFIKRRNSEIPLSSNCSQTSLSESNASSTPVHQRQMPMSPRKDNDKPSLNRRLWKQITKRRRANSVSEIAAS